MIAPVIYDEPKVLNRQEVITVLSSASPLNGIIMVHTTAVPAHIDPDVPLALAALSRPGRTPWSVLKAQYGL